MGRERTGSSSETGLLKEWPKDGPKLLWEVTDIGNGYSTPAVVGNRLYVISNRDQDEYLLCLDTKDGKQVWQTKIGKVGPNTPMMPWPGSRSTPTVDGQAAREQFQWTPQRPASEVEFKRAYARVASAAGLTREQAVRVYAFETGGNGNHDMQSGLSIAAGRARSRPRSATTSCSPPTASS